MVNLFFVLINQLSIKIKSDRRDTMDDNEYKPNYRNTRSRFFKRASDEDFNASFSSSQSSEQNTGTYWKNKGNQVFKQGHIETALQYYSKAIQLNDSESIFFSNRAKCYQILGNLDKALKDAEQACELDDENIKAHYHCGCILAELSKTNPLKVIKSQNRLKKALRLCSTLKKTQFADEISIKLFRLRKLQYLLCEQQKKQYLRQQKQLIKNAFHDGILDKIHYESMLNQHKELFENNKEKRQIPDYMLCKITLEIMEDPVTTEAGFTYERSAIEDYLKSHRLMEPITRKPFNGLLYPNISLKSAISDFLENNPWAFEFDEDENFMGIQFT